MGHLLLQEALFHLCDPQEYSLVFDSLRSALLFMHMSFSPLQGWRTRQAVINCMSYHVAMHVGWLLTELFYSPGVALLRIAPVNPVLARPAKFLLIMSFGHFDSSIQ